MPTFAKLRTDLVSAPVKADGVTYYNIKDPITGNFFRLREPEFWLLGQLDGDTSYEEIARRFRDKFDHDIDAAMAEQFVKSLEQMYFLDDGRAEQATSRVSYQVARGRSLFSRMLFVKLKAFNPKHLLNTLARLYAPFHSPVTLFLSALLILFGVGLILSNMETFTVSLSEVFQLGSIIAIVVAIFIIVFIHEFAHAVVCRHYGGEVREMGFLLLYFQPCFYSDLSDAWLFPRKSQRLAVTWAGPFMQLLLLALAALVWRVTVPGTFPNEVARIIAVVCWVTLLFNFNPLIKLDGYYLLADLVEVPNLRRKAFAYLGNAIKRRILGWPVSAQTLSARERRIFFFYAILAVIYSGLLIGYVLFIVAQFLLAKMGGWGLALLIAALVVALRPNIADLGHGVVRHVGFMKAKAASPIRVGIYLVVVASITYGLVGVPFPHRVSGEITIRPIAEFTLLLNEFGLLERSLQRRGSDAVNKSGYLQMTSTDMASLDMVPMFKDGQPVSEGDTLAVLVSNQVTSELTAALAELERLKSELDLLKSPPKQEEVDQAEAQVQAAKANLSRLEKEFERIGELRQKDLASSEEYDVAKSTVDIARAELADRRAHLNLIKSPPKPEAEAVLNAGIAKQEARVRFLEEQAQAQVVSSPISGIVETQNENSGILSVVDSRKTEVLVPVSDFDINLVEFDQEVSIKVRSFPGKMFHGKVFHIPSTARIVDDKAEFPVSVVTDNSNGLLQKGMTGYAKIHIGETSLAELLSRKLASFIRVEFWSWW